MSNQNNPAHSDQNSRLPLRRPMEPTVDKMLNGTSDEQLGRPILGSHGATPAMNPSSTAPFKSSLSVAAKEFVPQYFSINSNLSADSPEFIPQNQTYQSAIDQSDALLPMTELEMQHYAEDYRVNEQFQQLSLARPVHLQISESQGENPSIELVKSTIHYLTTNPGQVNSYMKSMVENLMSNNPNEATIDEMVEILIEQGISESNFRYTGAKICQYLCQHLVLQQQKTFRHTFLMRFGEEYNKKDDWIKTPSLHPRLCGLALFLGELFLNMEINSMRIGKFRSSIKDILLTLLRTPTDQTVKTACQLLKLTGAVIEETEHLNRNEGSNASFLDVFSRLEQISSNPDLGKTPLLLISSVLNLRASNWGRKDAAEAEPVEETQPLEHDPTFSSFSAQPIFYDKNGQPTQYFSDDTDMLQGFDYGDVLHPPWSSDETDYDDYLSLNNYGAGADMDDDMDDAYEEFLRMSGQS